MKLTKIYIGSNNTTKELELEKIENVLNRWQEGYTIIIIKAQGYWKGQKENTAIIEIYGNYNTGIIPELKRELEQDSILVAEFISDVNFY